MDDVWDNRIRIASIYDALQRIAHDQDARGMGFTLTHNPQRCLRCRATLATTELGAIIRQQESLLEAKEVNGDETVEL